MGILLECTQWGEWILRDEFLPMGFRQADLEELRAIERGEGARSLLWLNGKGKQWRLGAVWDWLRDFGRVVLERMAWQREDWGKLETCEIWHDLAQEFLLKAPEFLGREYVKVNALISFAVQIVELGQKAQDRELWLSQIDEIWNSVGKIVFHLAVPPAPAAKPFAFLATWVKRLNHSYKSQHIPLARAIKIWAKEPELKNLLEQLQNCAKCSPWLASMMNSGRLYRMESWEAADAWEFLQALREIRAAGIIVMLPDCWKNQPPLRVVAEVTLGSRPSSTGSVLGGMAGFDLALALNGKPLSEEELKLLSATGQGLVLLRGNWVEVDLPKVNQLLHSWQNVQKIYESGFSMIQALRWSIRGPKATSILANEVPKEAQELLEWSQVVEGDYWQEAKKQIKSPKKIDLVPGLDVKLRPYQQVGLEWMATMCAWGAGVCLADDMGLGKTLQVIALLLYWKNSLKRSKPWALIVAPASLLGNWAREMKKFAPSLQIRIEHPQVSETENVSKTCADVIITSYGMLDRLENLRLTSWFCVVLDEAQAIKNPGTRAHQNVCQLKANSRIALSGTPIENRALDLWALMKFLNPGLLGSAKEFEQWSEALAQAGDYSRLRLLVSPFLLRRLKTDPQVAPDLPEKVEILETCLMSRRQSILYARLVADFKKVLEETQGFEEDSVQKMKRQGAILTYMGQFKQLCNHPSLWNGDGGFEPELSGKFIRLAELSQEWKKTGERVLIFTQFQSLCEPLAHYMEKLMGQSGLVLHGATPVARRQLLVEEFQKSKGPPFFIISVKAGGTGLTLTRASHVVHFDRWWNPAVENQATDRAHRIGQSKTVFVHKLETRGTIEQKIGRMLEEKNQLAKDLLGTGVSAASELANMSNQELFEALFSSD